MPSVIHFALFVRACIECHRRNSQPPTIIVVTGAPGAYYAATPQGVQPIPIQYMPQPPPNVHLVSRQGGMSGYHAPQMMQLQANPGLHNPPPAVASAVPSAASPVVASAVPSAASPVVASAVPSAASPVVASAVASAVSPVSSEATPARQAEAGQPSSEP